MNHSTPGLPVHHQLVEFTQTHAHWVGDTIQPSHSLSSPSPPAFNLAQHQSLFQWNSSLYQMAKVLELQLQHQSFQWILRTDFLHDGLVGFPCSPRDSQESSSTSQFKTINFLALSFLYGPILTSIHDYWKSHSQWTFVSKVMSLFPNTLSRLVIAFLSRSKRLLISWLQSLSTVIFEPKKIKSIIVSPSICHEVMQPDAMIFIFWMLSFKPAFLLSSFTFIKRLLNFSLPPAIGWCHLHFWGYWYFSWESWFQLVIHPNWHFTWCILQIVFELFQILKDDAVKVLHSICQPSLKNSAVATGLEKVSFHSNSKERQCQRMLKLLHNCTHLTC